MEMSTARIVWYSILSVVVTIGLIVGGWLLTVALSGPVGKGNAIIQKNSAGNFIEQQAQFHTNFETVRSLTTRERTAQAQLDAYNSANPNIGQNGYDPRVQVQANYVTTVQGLQQECNIATADYNAKTETFVAQDFRDADLPFKMQATDPVFVNGNYNWSEFNCGAPK